MKYLIVERWEEFQHYKKRAPLFIKNYTRLLHDDTYLSLTGHRRAVLHGLWLVYASSSCQLHFDPKSLSSRLHLRVTLADLKALRKAGYIEVSASKPLAPCYQVACLEIETEIEKELPPSPPSGKTSSNGKIECPECGPILLPRMTTLADHRYSSHGVEAIDGRSAA
jgi:hypothetical protein